MQLLYVTLGGKYSTTDILMLKYTSCFNINLQNKVNFPKLLFMLSVTKEIEGKGCQEINLSSFWHLK